MLFSSFFKNANHGLSTPRKYGHVGGKVFCFLAWCSDQGKSTNKDSEESKKSQDDDGALVERRNKNESADQERHGKWGSNTGEMRERNMTWGHEAGVQSSGVL